MELGNEERKKEEGEKAPEDVMMKDFEEEEGEENGDSEDELDHSLHPIQILIDELKNDDLEVRLNTMGSLALIAEALGAERSREELLPFLTQHGTNDEDEVTLILAEQLGSFCDVVGGSEYAHTLLPPLEKLAAQGESEVREQAVKSIEKVIGFFSTENVVKFVIPVTFRLAKGEVGSRVACCMMLSLLLSVIPVQEKENIYILFARLCEDEKVQVRKEISTQIKKMSKNVEKIALKETVIPKFGQLAADDQDSVRLLCVENAIELANILREEGETGMLRRYVLPAILSCASDKSWRVRVTVADLFCQVCEALGTKVAGEHMISLFATLLKDGEAEVRTAAAANIVGVCSFVEGEAVMREIFPALKSLAVDPSQYVRVSFAKVIMDLVPICGKEKTTTLLLELFMQLLKDENPDVRLSIISRLGVVLEKSVSLQQLEKSFLPAIVTLADDKQWRVRLAIIEHMPLLAQKLGREYFNKKLGAVCFAWLHDAVYTIREAATMNLKKLAGEFGGGWVECTLLPEILELRKSDKYLYRVTCIIAVKELAPSTPPKVLQNTLLPLLIDLSADQVPNVRFNSVLALKAVLDLLGEEGKGVAMRCIKRMEEDPDLDVKYYARND